MSRGNILITGASLHEQARKLIADLDYQPIYTPQYCDEDTLKSLTEEYDPIAILVRVGKVSASIIDAAPSLRVISKHGVGVDNIDTDRAAALGIPVIVTAGANVPPVAEHALALMFAAVKTLLLLDKSVRDGRWEKPSYVGRDMRGMRLGLVGFGGSGRRIAPLAIALEMQVLAFDPFVSSSLMAAEGVQFVDDINDLLRESDIVSFHCPLTSDNRKILNARSIAFMKHGSIVINTARGGLIDEDALVAALKTGKIAAAGIDTFALEPPAAEHPFFSLPNVILTPHVAGTTIMSLERVGIDAVQGIHAVLSGEPLSPARFVKLKRAVDTKVEANSKSEETVAANKARN